MAINFKLSNCPFCDSHGLDLFFHCSNVNCVGSEFKALDLTDLDRALSWNRFCNSEREQIRFLAQIISKKL